MSRKHRGGFARPRVLRTILRVASRDFRRRPAQSSLVVAGLLISSLVISAALVAGDSMEALFVRTTLGAWGPLDAIAGSPTGVDFSEDAALSVARAPEVREVSDGAAPRLLLRAAAEDVDKKSREGSVRLIGVDPVRDRAVGEFRDGSGRSVDVEQGQALINRRFARALGAERGDRITFTAAGRGSAVRIAFTVGAVLPDRGKADFNRLPDAFVDLDELQTAAGMQGRVNQLVVSARGAPSDTELFSFERAIERSSNRLGFPLEVVSSKREDLQDSKEQTRFFRAILGMLGTIVALASVALIANLFVMLGEERRSERGAMRALGLTRMGSVILAVTEGIFYSAAAAVLGALVGAFLGRYLADAMGDLFSTFAGNSGFEFVRAPFEMRAGTLVRGGLAGFVVSLLSVLIVSIRTSRMNIVAAIRGLPQNDDKRRKSVPWRPILLMLLGGAALLGPDIAKVIGGGALILGASSLISRYTRPRIGATLGGIAGLAWGFWANTFLADFEQDPESAFAMVTTAGVVTVVAAVTLISANLDVVRRLAPALGTKTGMAFRIASAYTSGFRFRTAMSMAMFGLVVYMIAAFAIWGGFGGGDVSKQKGGFDVLARSTVPIEDFQAPGASAVVGMNLTVYQSGYRVDDSREVRFPVRLYGVGQEMAKHSRFEFAKKGRGKTGRDVWERLASDPGTAVLDQSSAPGDTEVGDVLHLQTDAGPRELEVIGVADEVSLGGIFVSERLFAEIFPARAGRSSWLIKAAPGTSLQTLIADSERRFADFGLDAQSIEEIFDEAASAQRSFVGIFQLLLKLGLVIGISGLAIGAVRTVLERRQAIGILRAMGFRRRMIAGWLLIETLLVATLGVLTGLTVGLVGTYWLITEQVPSFEFSVDRGQITSTLIIIYSAVLLFTAIPAGRAAKLKPSEAVRYVE